MLGRQRPGDKHALYTLGRADQPSKTTTWCKRFNYARYWRLILSDWAAAASQPILGGRNTGLWSWLTFTAALHFLARQIPVFGDITLPCMARGVLMEYPSSNTGKRLNESLQTQLPALVQRDPGRTTRLHYRVGTASKQQCVSWYNSVWRHSGPGCVLDT